MKLNYNFGINLIPENVYNWIQITWLNKNLLGKKK